MSKQKLDSKRKHNPETTSQASEYIRLYTEENYPLREIANQFKVGVSTGYNSMVSAGFTEFRARSSRTSHTRMSMEQQAIALYQSGLTRSAIVQKLNVAARTLNKILEKHNIPIRRGIDPVTSANRAAQYNKAYNDYNLTLRETAELFGISHPIVLQELKRNGYPIRQSVDSKNRLKLRLKHKLGGIAGLAVPKLTPRQRERRQILLRIRQRQEDKLKQKRLEGYARAQEYWQLVCEGGLDFDQVGAMFGVTGKTVERIIKRNGIDIKELSRKEKAEAFKEDAVIAKQYWDLYNQPMSLENVGKMFGLSDSTIRLVLLKHGYEIRKRGRLFNTAPTIRKPKSPKKSKVVVVSEESVVATSNALDFLAPNTPNSPNTKVNKST